MNTITSGFDGIDESFDFKDISNSIPQDKWCAVTVVSKEGIITFMRIVRLHKLLWFKWWTEILRIGKG